MTRRYIVDLELTAERWQALWRRAALARLPLSHFLVAAAFDDAMRVPTVELRLYGRLGRAVIDLEQAVRRASEEPRDAALREPLVHLLDELREIRRCLANLTRGAAGEPL